MIAGSRPSGPSYAVLGFVTSLPELQRLEGTRMGVGDDCRKNPIIGTLPVLIVALLLGRYVVAGLTVGAINK